MSDVILMSQMYAGKYLEKGIGHEVINLFKDSERHSYIYVPPSGKIGVYTVKGKEKGDNRKIEARDIKRVIFVRHFAKKKTVEVVAIAKKVTEFKDDGNQDIKYGGQTLKKIFGEDEASKDAPITFFAKDGVCIPKIRILITMLDEAEFPDRLAPEGAKLVRLANEEASCMRHKTLTNQSLRTYFLSDIDREAYDKLNNLMDDSSLWDNREEEFVVQESETMEFSLLKPSFLEIIKKVDDELVFSNLFAYYFLLNRSAFLKFAKEFLFEKNKPTQSLQENFSIDREKEHVDLWIEDDNNIVIIENKIKSGINGIAKDGSKSQLTKYYDVAQEYAQYGKRKNQLKEKERKEIEASGKKPKQTHFFIFVPNYSEIKLDDNSTESKYVQITYLQLYEFFKSNKEKYKSDPYFEDFLKGLKYHTMRPADLNYEIMKSRFSEKIKNVQE